MKTSMGGVVLVLSAALLAGCKSASVNVAQTLQQQGAIRLSGPKVALRLVGNTERWQVQRSFYSADGSLEVQRGAALMHGRYTIEPSGRVCIALKEQPQHCHFYMNHAGQVLAIVEGKNLGEQAVVEGRVLTGH
ncbi:MAG: hypothetical protein ACPG4U_16370 [Pseudomonadales bacterium]